MIQLTLAQAATLLDQSTALQTSFQGISIDTRTLQPGNLFIAIKGEQADGHDFLAEAYQKGAAAAIVDRQLPVPIPQLVVADTTTTLGKLGAAWRNQFSLPIVAITGSNGKTTLKNMMAAILVAACHNDSAQVLATKGTLNNHWGLPLTLACLNNQHRYAVIEMGMNHFGEIDYLTQLTKPDVAIITNAAASHLEGVGDVAGVARAKSEIFNGLTEKGIAILNRDDVFFPFWREQIGDRPYLTFGFHPDADVTTESQTSTEMTILLRTPPGSLQISLPLLGRHNLLNALAATAAALAMGIDLAAIKSGLEHITPAPGRVQLHTLANGVNVIDDTYNANPFSLLAAVETLAAFTGKKILVLGDMKELGANAESFHSDAGGQIRQAGIDYLFTYGNLSKNAAQTFGEGACHFSEQHELVDALKPLLYNTTTILVKGSRSMRMEKVIAELLRA
ncbi:MAG TPA: UDP-N-acetylmuramoyl-tripeptide--D-alanyl-D-alanine ligase [Gammaproteobacteria bacterium]|jgi:UDP-N-acetylmuramoyl-tripeptide--D-alanyl-D-alanine ligase|nr:UDP-N-acetylmuramoyl-tripeptide--D-alanyl-D-alanine ligase [Gammaproteobacteria bacterium]